MAELHQPLPKVTVRPTEPLSKRLRRPIIYSLGLVVLSLAAAGKGGRAYVAEQARNYLLGVNQPHPTVPAPEQLPFVVPLEAGGDGGEPAAVPTVPSSRTPIPRPTTTEVMPTETAIPEAAPANQSLFDLLDTRTRAALEESHLDSLYRDTLLNTRLTLGVNGIEPTGGVVIGGQLIEEFPSWKNGLQIVANFILNKAITERTRTTAYVALQWNPSFILTDQFDKRTQIDPQLQTAASIALGLQYAWVHESSGVWVNENSDGIYVAERTQILDERAHELGLSEDLPTDARRLIAYLDMVNTERAKPPEEQDLNVGSFVSYLVTDPANFIDPQPVRIRPVVGVPIDFIYTDDLQQFGAIGNKYALAHEENGKLIADRVIFRLNSESRESREWFGFNGLLNALDSLTYPDIAARGTRDLPDTMYFKDVELLTLNGIDYALPLISVPQTAPVPTPTPTSTPTRPAEYQGSQSEVFNNHLRIGSKRKYQRRQGSLAYHNNMRPHS